MVSHNTAMTYMPNQIFVITKSREKDKEGDLAGYKFTINIHKSRFVKERSKFPFTVLYEKGIMKWSGLLELAMDLNYVAKPKVGWYQQMDPATGELIGEKMYREKEINESDAFWSNLIANTDFREVLKKTFTLGETALVKKLDEESLDDEEFEDGDA